MSATIDIRDPENPTRILMVASNPSVSPTTGWPIGFWWAELTHPWFEFTERGYEVTIASPDGGDLVADPWSDPRDESEYSAHDLISLGFVSSPRHSALIADTPSLGDVDASTYDAVFLVGGQAPMVTFRSDDRIKRLVADTLSGGRVVAVVCHATCVLLDAVDESGRLLVEGRTWTGFADSEERFADEFVGQRIQPFWIEEEARKLSETNFVVASRFKPFALRDGNLVTGQQQYSGAAAARLVIEALGV